MSHTLKKILKIASFSFVFLLALAALAQGVAEPQTAAEAAQDVLEAIKLKNMGAWAACSLAIVQVLIFIIKAVDETNVKMKKWGTSIILVLSAGAAILGSVVGGLGWKESLILFMFTGASKFVNDLMHEIGILEHQAKPPDQL